MKYKVVKIMAAEFGRRAHVFVISKKTWLGFYWDTDEYYFREEEAQKRCEWLNSTYQSSIKHKTFITFLRYIQF